MYNHLWRIGMKKLVLLFIVFCALFMFTGCSSKNVEGSLEDIMTKLYDGISEENLPMGLSNIEVNSENIEYYLGTSDIKYTEALASEPMITSIAHSVVLLRVQDGEDVEAIKTKIKDNVNPRKWLCVGVENVIVKSKGDLIVLIMNDTIGEEISTNFDSL